METPAQKCNALTHKYIREQEVSFENLMEPIYKNLLWYIENFARNNKIFEFDVSVSGIMQRASLKVLTKSEIDYIADKLKKDGFGVTTIEFSNGQINELHISWNK
jgi:hypothetical protein